MRQRLMRLHRRWEAWCSLSINRSIFGAALTVAVLNLFVKVLTVIKDVAVADMFGVNDALDAFLIAYLIPSVTVSVIAGSFYSAFVPVYVDVKGMRGDVEAKHLFSLVAFIVMVVLVVVTAVFFLSDEWLLKRLASGFSPTKQSLTVRLYDQMLPFILIGGMTLFCGAVLNGEKKFALAAIAPILTPLTTILILYFSSQRSDPQQLVYGIIVGIALEFCVILWGLHKMGYLCLPRWGKPDRNCLRVINQYIPMIGGALLMSGTVVVDQVMAAWQTPGGVSALSYASKVPNFTTSFATTILGTALLPYLSQLASSHNFVALKNTLLTYTILILKLTVPLTLLAVFFSKELVVLLFERGEFDGATSSMVSIIQQCYLLQVPFYLLGILCVRLISALSGNKIIIIIALFNFLVNIVGNLLLLKLIGISGIALSTSIVYLFSTALCYLYIYYRFESGR